MSKVSIFKTDNIYVLIGFFYCVVQIIAKCGNAQNSAAVGENVNAIGLCSRVEKDVYKRQILHLLL